MVIEHRGGVGLTTMKEYVLLVPRVAKLIAGLLRDPRVPAKPKATLAFVAVYLVSPIDLIPSFVPGLGQLDDLVVAALALDGLLNHVPEAVVRDHWEGDDDILEIVQEVLRQFTARVPFPLRKLFNV
jgi:uncharacterized membrane protein YkvA (DUF1232 family)